MFGKLLAFASPTIWAGLGVLVLLLLAQTWRLDNAQNEVELLEKDLQAETEDRLEAENVANNNADDVLDLAQELRSCVDTSAANENAARAAGREAEATRVELARVLKRNRSERKVIYEEDQACAAWSAMRVCSAIEQQLRQSSTATDDH